MRKWDKLVDQYHGLDTTIRDLESKLTELRSQRAAALSSAPVMETQELRFKFCAQTQKVFVDPKHQSGGIFAGEVHSVISWLQDLREHELPEVSACLDLIKGKPAPKGMPS